jgi:hypothetical protein
VTCPGAGRVLRSSRRPGVGPAPGERALPSPCASARVSIRRFRRDCGRHRTSDRLRAVGRGRPSSRRRRGRCRRHLSLAVLPSCVRLHAAVRDAAHASGVAGPSDRVGRAAPPAHLCAPVVLSPPMSDTLACARAGGYMAPEVIDSPQRGLGNRGARTDGERVGPRRVSGEDGDAVGTDAERLAKVRDAAWRVANAIGGTCGERPSGCAQRAPRGTVTVLRAFAGAW